MKSQSSTEFMIFIGIAIIILMSYVAIAHHYLNLTYKQKDIISGQDLAKQIKNEINLASRVEENYIRIFQLPYKVGNKDFTVLLNGREVVVRMDGVDYVEPLATNINEEDEGEFNPGFTFEIRKTNDGEMRISVL
jgi:hypothetical protein